MAPSTAQLLSSLCLGVGLTLSVAHAHAHAHAHALHLDLDTFAGQAEASLLEEAVAENSRHEVSKLMARASDVAPDYSCSKTKPCKLGCCGASDAVTGVAVYGMGPTFCGASCISECDSKSECNPGWGLQWSNSSLCPLNVCCSNFGFCGTTPSFCNNILATSPQCSQEQRTSDARTIGYYEWWNFARPYGNMEPEDIPLGCYTHINFVFALINPTTYRMDVMDEGTASRYSRVTALKAKQ
ncbi:hypothetical protein B0T19DRAFT_459130 [Cercophora scortea]|uniref:Chitin-binding type-1 domain-containing protein n=1 Tax=Cercophora scortea TaxID=314031 RepID=A0AAE0IZH1_9PEZI|nr:hypothetical protein B0T19DRAFT_459130 [Cercophora scortea]